MINIWHRPWAAPAAVFVLAVVLYSLNLDRPPHADELHHVLAAQYLLDTGRPILAEGEYWRGILHTWLVALSYAIFGEGLASARIPSVIAVALVVALLHVWVRREAGSRAAWLTTVLFATSPYTVEIAQFCRFYALQLLFFTTGCIAAFYGVVGTGSRWRTLLLWPLAALLLATATWLQVTTLMGILGLAVWVGAAWLQRGLLRFPAEKRLRYGLVALALVALVVAAASAVAFQEFGYLIERYQSTALFAAERADEYWYYHLRYQLFYPSLWPVVAVLAALAIAQSPRIGWLAAVVFTISFLVTSFAAQKATRYFSYAQPFLAIIWGLGLASVLPVLAQHVRKGLGVVVESTGVFAKRAPQAAGLAAVVLGLTVLVANPFWLRSATMIADVAMPMEVPMADWRAARAALEPWTKTADIMITTEELGAIYFLGRSDVRFSRSKFYELRPEQRFEFGIDDRTGRPIISRAESVELLMRCFPKGFIVGPRETWGSPILIDEEVQAVIRAHARPIEVPKSSHLFAWGWDRSPASARADACEKLPESIANSGRNRPGPAERGVSRR